MKINDIMKLSAEIQNFFDCYNDTILLYAKPQSEGRIDPEDLLGFLLANPHLMEIAQRVKDLGFYYEG